MRTLEQIRAARKRITDELRTLRDLAKSEGRDLTDEETTQLDGLLDQDDALALEEKRATRLESRSAAMNTPTTPAPVTDPATGDPRRDPAGPVWPGGLGEQLQSIIRSERRGVPIDPRLIEVRAQPGTAVAGGDGATAGEQRLPTGYNEGVGSEGAFLLAPEHSTTLLEAVIQSAELWPRCTAQPIGSATNRLSLPATDQTSRVDGSRQGGITAYWEEEAATFTASKGKFRLIELILRKLIGLTYVTDELKQDVPALAAYVTRQFAREFEFKLDDGVCRGTGAGVPLGWLNSPATISVSAEDGQGAATILGENIKKMYARMWAPGVKNMIWAINQDCWEQIFALHQVIGTSGVALFIPAGGLSGAPYGTLLGRPVIPIEHASTCGTVGDISAVDLTQWIAASKGGLQQDESIHVAFTTAQSTLRWILRADGRPAWSSALTPYQGTTTTGPFITLASRT